jgi:3-deoxy-7-phosphoheptulonate synthase
MKGLKKMSYKFLRELPPPNILFQEIPVSEEIKKVKAARDKEIQDVLTGKSGKFILIIGPCSADNEDSVLSYIERLAKVQEEVKDDIVIIPRVYTNKPRTTGEGYKGMLHQPDPNKVANMYEGIKAIRKLHLRTIESSHLSCADEMLYPENYAYLDDLLSYVAVGARSVENQQHRLTVSGFNVPAGMKNPTSGDLSVMLNSIKAGQIGHHFIYRGWEVETEGNPLTHAILRGAVNQYGRSIPNYHYEDLMRLIEEYESRNLDNPAIIIDVNHANSDKQFNQQPRIASEIIHNRRKEPIIGKYVKGLMIESYLEEGSQAVNGGIFGKSITDPCLGWPATERLIYHLVEKMNQ